MYPARMRSLPAFVLGAVAGILGMRVWEAAPVVESDPIHAGHASVTEEVVEPEPDRDPSAARIRELEAEILELRARLAAAGAAGRSMSPIGR